MPDTSRAVRIRRTIRAQLTTLQVASGQLSLTAVKVSERVHYYRSCHCALCSCAVSAQLQMTEMSIM